MVVALILMAVCLIILGAVAGKPLGWVVVGLSVIALLLVVVFPTLAAPWGR